MRAGLQEAWLWETMPGFYKLLKQLSWTFLFAALPLPCNTLLLTLSKVQDGIKSSLVFSFHLSFLQDVDPGTYYHPGMSYPCPVHRFPCQRNDWFASGRRPETNSKVCTMNKRGTGSWNKSWVNPTWQHQAVVNPEIHVLLTQEMFWCTREKCTLHWPMTEQKSSVYVNWQRHTEQSGITSSNKQI